MSIAVADGAFAAVRRRWRRIAVAALAGLALAAGGTDLVTPVYQADVRLQTSARDPGPGSAPVRGVRADARAATSPEVLQPVLRRSGSAPTPEELADRIGVTVPIGTTAIVLRVSDPTPEGAAAAANAVGERLAQVIEQSRATGPGPPVRVTIAVPAVPPSAPVWPNLPVNLMTGLLAGLLVGAGPALLRAFRTGVLPSAGPAAPVDGVQARVAAAACLVLLVALPVQWTVLASTPVGVLRPFHVAAAVMLLLYGIGVGRWHGLFASSAPVLGALVVLTASAVVAALGYGGRWADPVQHLAYALVGLVFGAALYAAVTHANGLRVLVWSAPAAVTCALAGMGVNLAAASVDPVALVGRALAEGDPRPVVFGVFRRAIPTAEIPGLASARHEVMAALLLSILVTALAAVAARHWVRLVALVSCAAGGAVVLLSLSRSVLLVAAAGALVAIARVALRARWRTRVALSVAAAGVAAVGWPLVRLVGARAVADTGSYDARLAAFDYYPPSELLLRVAAGGPEPPESPHVLPLDVVLQAGWVAGVCALVVVGAVTIAAASAGLRHVRTGSTASWVAATAALLVLMRSLTTGGGYLHLVEWAAFGMVVALTAGWTVTVVHGRRRRGDEPG